MSEWQPIETAPKDGTQILIYRQAIIGSQAVAYWTGDSWAITYGPKLLNVTHWIPLPFAPAISEKLCARQTREGWFRLGPDGERYPIRRFALHFGEDEIAAVQACFPGQVIEFRSYGRVK